MPLLSFDVYPASGVDPMTLARRRSEGGSDEGEDEVQKKRWFKYVPLGVLLFIIFLPHPSYLITLISFFLKTRHAPWRFAVHLLAVHALTLGALVSLVVCVVRDPGGVGRERNGTRNINESRVGPRQKKNPTQPHERDADAEDGVTTSLLRSGEESYDGGVLDAGREDAEAGYDVRDECLGAAEDGEAATSSRTNPDVDIDIDAHSLNGRWCGRCRHARPERAHHCGACGRCVLKMDHHCPWLGGNCIGHRTYPAFVHFLLMSTLLAAYITCVAFSVVAYLISDPFSIDPHTSPLHPLFLLLIGAVFTLMMGSFLLYHLYLVSTNQTTLEHMSPFLLLRYIPPPPPPPPQLETPQTDDIPSYTPYDPQQPLAPPPLIGSDEHASPVSLETPLQLIHSNATAMAARHSNTTTRPFRTTLPYYPPDEHELSSAQRRVVQHVHGQVRLYDLGWRRNWGEVFGGGRPRSYSSHGYGDERESGGGRGSWWQWVGVLVVCGGTPRGDGKTFERGKGAKRGLERLVRGLEDVRRTEGSGWRWGGEL